MKLFCLSDIGTDKSTYRATWVYRESFHGTAGPVVNRYDEPPYRPLPLIRNIRLLPDVFFAGISLVASESIADQLSSFDGVRLNPCIWDKVYDFPVTEDHVRRMYSKFSAITDDYGTWLEQQYFPPPPDIARLKYFEVLTPRFQSVGPPRGPLTESTLPSPVYKRLPPLQTCAGLHRAYPILEYTPYYLCIEPVFRILEPHVTDRALFGVHEIELPH